MRESLKYTSSVDVGAGSAGQARYKQNNKEEMVVHSRRDTSSLPRLIGYVKPSTCTMLHGINCYDSPKAMSRGIRFTRDQLLVQCPLRPLRVLTLQLIGAQQLSHRAWQPYSIGLDEVKEVAFLAIGIEQGQLHLGS